MKLTALGANRNEVQFANGVTVLYSYQTPVAVIVPGHGYAKSEVGYSNTTAKHIGQWVPSGTAKHVPTVPQSYIDALANNSGVARWPGEPAPAKEAIPEPAPPLPPERRMKFRKRPVAP